MSIGTAQDREAQFVPVRGQLGVVTEVAWQTHKSQDLDRRAECDGNLQTLHGCRSGAATVFGELSNTSSQVVNEASAMPFARAR